MANKKVVAFKFEPFSIKQKKLLTFWNEESPVKNKDGIIADGAVRSGKTVAMSLSFLLFAIMRVKLLHCAARLLIRAGETSLIL
jgi:hypothetical protein